MTTKKRIEPVTDASNQQTRYILNVRLEIQKQTQYSGDQYWRTDTNERLSISEDLSLGQMDFQDLLSVLGQLDAAVKGITAAPSAP